MKSSRFLERKLSKELCAKLCFASFGSAWLLPCCLAGPRMRADETSAPTERLPYGSRGGGLPPAEFEPAPTAGGNRRAFLVQPGSPPEASQPAAAARKREQSTAPPAPDARKYFREASPVAGVRGRATGVLALPGANPRGSLVLSIPGKNTKKRIPPPRRRVPLPTAAKEPKRRFFGALGWFFSSGAGSTVD